MCSLLLLATKLGQGYVFTRVCDSVQGGGVIPACIAGGIPACLAAGLQGGWYPSMPCRFPGPHPRGKLRSLAWGVSRTTPKGGVSRPTPGVSPGPHWGCLQAHAWGISRPTPRGTSRPTPRGGSIPACTEADPPPPTATAADGTHPTGMHSCWSV